MTESMLNQIFYPYKKFDAENIGLLVPWMLTRVSLTKLEEQPLAKVEEQPSAKLVEQPLTKLGEQPLAKVEEQPSAEAKQPLTELVEQENTMSPTNQRVHSMFSPNKTDTLFWCIYTIFHGESAYHMIGNRFRNTEIEEKQRVMEHIKKNADIFRGSVQHTKITKVAVQEILSDLMLNKKTSWQTFAALCYYYKINAIITYNKTYYECISTQEYPIYQFTRTPDGHISVDTDPLTQETIDTIRQSHIVLEYTKTIKSIGTYKVQDLLSMANVLDIVEPVNAKWKKADWYQAIADRCLW
jgi:hypothetical protein